MAGNTYQPSIDSDREITADAKMNSLTKLAAGPTPYSFDMGSSNSRTKALGYRKISKDKVVWACNCHTLHLRGLCPSTTFWRWNCAKPDLKHLSPTIILSLAIWPAKNLRFNLWNLLIYVKSIFSWWHKNQEVISFVWGTVDIRERELKWKIYLLKDEVMKTNRSGQSSARQCFDYILFCQKKRKNCISRTPQL